MLSFRAGESSATSSLRLIVTAVLSLWWCAVSAQEPTDVPAAAPSSAPANAAGKIKARSRDDKHVAGGRKKSERPDRQALKAERKDDGSPKAAEAAPTTGSAASTSSQPHPSPEVAPVIQPAAPQGAGEPTGEFEPVVHARNAKLTTCMDKIVSLSAHTIDRPHSAVSTYVAAAANDHVFQSIIGMNYANKIAPNGAAIILAAPIANSRCEGETVQVYPTTNSCTAVQASLINNGRTLTTLRSLPLLQTKDGNRELLVPTAGGGCVVVSVGLY